MTVGGTAFTHDKAIQKRNVQRFCKKTWEQEKERIFDILAAAGCVQQTTHPPWMSQSSDSIQRFYVAGSTGKKEDSGDADIVAMYNGTRDDLMSQLTKTLLDGMYDVNPPAVVKIGEDVSFAYHIHSNPGVYIQVDVNCAANEQQYNWKTWTHWGAAPGSLRQAVVGSGISRFKGALRAFMLESVLDFLSSKDFPGLQNDITKTVYSLNVGKGLFKSIKTRVGKKPGVINKTWSEIYRGDQFGNEGVPITLDPDAAIAMMFGTNAKAYEARTLEDVVTLVKQCDCFAMNEKLQIVEAFLNKMRGKVSDSSKWSRVAPSQSIAMSILQDVEEYVKIQFL